ncbi:protein phosphatase 1 regulatory subunit 12C-like [Pollicipes pollicipes]|uniref:protein phosphatase 1 regulatory subunit 12C-like n=1 Tax=Pollicipes pollicipes TaxID=41117 RepID=UPI00188593A8|nr:protein phosphatase 1 regulatory subunit 12C-like [Pollicipes pollicipes]
MALENRNSALFKRAEQLRRWQESDTNREDTTLKDNNRRIMFSDACVFLAACAAGEKDEVKRLLVKGVDIDTTDVDGLTALHQACIGDNLDMVEFLVQHGADVNRGDNEGWTPLHATSSCGFLSISKYLIDQGADVAAVNNDGELPIDICETDEVGDMLQREIDLRGIDCDASRTEEENLLLSDAHQWLSAGQIMEQPHPKTGATGLHVAAAKGYIKAMHLLLKCGADINAQDYDGWTPLHAAGHWAQREACELLAESLCNMDIKNFVGQTAFDVADAEVLTVLEQLKSKQAMLQRERPEIEQILTRRPLPPLRHRTSVTRLSGPDKANQAARDASEERERLQGARIEEDERAHLADGDAVELRNKTNQQRRAAPAGQPPPPAPGFTPRPPDGAETDQAQAQSWRRPAAAQRLSAPDDSRNNKREEPSSRLTEPAEVRRTQSAPAPPSPAALPSEQTVSATIIQSPPSSPVTPGAPAVRSGASSDVDGPRREPAAPALAPAGEPAPATAPAQGKVLVDQQPAPPASTGSRLSPATIFKNIFKSFVPPVRDEESETQRKAHAKRVRETRRSTQGVTLEELKSAEQYVKNQQQQQKTTTTPASAPAPPPPPPSAREEPAGRDEPMERRPSWRLRLDEGDKNKFSLEEVRGGGDATRDNANATVTLPLRRKSNSADTAPGPGAAPLDDKDEDKENDSRTAVATQAAIQRRRKPKRRSTGVVQFDVEENERKGGRDGDGSDSGTLVGGSRRGALAVFGMPLNSGLRRLNGSYGGAVALSQSAASCISPRLAYSSSPSFSGAAGSGGGGGSGAAAHLYQSVAGYSAPPAHGGYSSPSRGGYSSPSHGGYSSPSHGGYSSPSHGGYSSPSHGGYSSPSHGGYSSPSHGGSSTGHLSRPRSKLSYSGSLGRSTPRPRARSVHGGSPTTAGLNLSPALVPRAPAVRAGRSPSLSSSLGSLSGRSYSSGYGSTSALSNQSNANASECNSRTPSRANSVENGELDYKKLYEDAMVENDKLQQRLAEAQADSRDAKLNLDKTLQMSSSRVAAAESDKREKRALERKLSEMEEELKHLQTLKAENEKLKAENRALTRVVSKLTNAAGGAAHK